MPKDNTTTILSELALKDDLDVGTQKVNDIIHEGDDELPAPMAISTMENAGHVYVYDTRTGDRSKVNQNMLLAQIRKKREDGTLVFSLTKPSNIPTREAHLCMLHPKHENRKHYDEMGLPVCTAANIPNQHEVTLHMKSKHRKQWEAIEGERITREREEDRELQRRVLESNIKAPLYTKTNK